MRLTLTALFLIVAAETAIAHGGGGFRGPTGHFSRGIPCSCAKIDCDKCATASLRSAADYARVRTKVTELKRWGDLARLRISMTFESRREKGTVEGYARLRPAPVFAAVAGSVQSLDATPLLASLQPSETARRKYLWIRRTTYFDPLLVMRRRAGVIDVRAFPIEKARPMSVEIEGFALLPRIGIAGVRIYRTGERYLTVGPKAKYEFLSAKQCRARHGTAAAIIVPCIPQLETAATGRGRGAAGNATVLVALPEGAKSPPFVGPDVWVGGMVPPSLGHSGGPEPPPPPPAG